MKSNKTKETLDVFLSRVEELNSGIANITENAEKLKTIQKKVGTHGGAYDWRILKDLLGTLWLGRVSTPQLGIPS